MVFTAPLKVFAEIGGNLSAGLAEGITGKSGLVTNAMNKINGNLSATANLSVSGGYSGASSSTFVSQLILDSKILGQATSKVLAQSNRGPIARAGGAGMIKIKFHDAALTELATLNAALSASKAEKLNSENTLNFFCRVKDSAAAYLNENTVCSLDGDYYDIAFFKSAQQGDGLLLYDVQCEHVRLSAQRSGLQC